LNSRELEDDIAGKDKSRVVVSFCSNFRGEMIQFDLRIFFKWVVKHQLTGVAQAGEFLAECRDPELWRENA